MTQTRRRPVKVLLHPPSHPEERGVVSSSPEAVRFPTRVRPVHSEDLAEAMGLGPPRNHGPSPRTGRLAVAGQALPWRRILLCRCCPKKKACSCSSITITRLQVLEGEARSSGDTVTLCGCWIACTRGIHSGYCLYCHPKESLVRLVHPLTQGLFTDPYCSQRKSPIE